MGRPRTEEQKQRARDAAKAYRESIHGKLMIAAWRERNRESIRQKRKERHEKFREQENEVSKRYYHEHKALMNERAMQYYHDHREELNERARARHAADPEAHRENARRYYLTHRDEIRAKKRARAAEKRAARKALKEMGVTTVGSERRETS